MTWVDLRDVETLAWSPGLEMLETRCMCLTKPEVSMLRLSNDWQNRYKVLRSNRHPFVDSGSRAFVSTPSL